MYTIYIKHEDTLLTEQVAIVDSLNVVRSIVNLVRAEYPMGVVWVEDQDGKEIEL